jgi:CRISPR/Cas system-associated endonuclease Cas1
MTIKELLNRVKLELHKRKNQLANEMIEGRISDLNHYHKSVGIAEGLMISQDVIDETLEKIEKEDE